MTTKIPPSPPALFTLYDAANHCGISWRELLTHASNGALDLCIKLPPKYTAYVTLKNYVNLGGSGGLIAVPFPDLIDPKPCSGAFATLLTREHCISLLRYGEASLEYFPAAIEPSGNGRSTVARPWDINFLPGLDERIYRSSLDEIINLSNWVTEGGTPPEAAIVFHLNELSYWADKRKQLFRLENLHTLTQEPWCLLDARARRVRHTLEYWICLYPDDACPFIHPSYGISPPASLTISPENVRVQAEELEDFLLRRMKNVRYARDYFRSSDLDELPLGASKLLRDLNEVSIEIWGNVSFTSDSFMDRKDVASILVGKYGFGQKMAESAAGIIQPDFAEIHFPVYKRAMFGKSFRSFRWEALIQAFEEFWEGKDPTKASDCTLNVDVMAWLQELHHFPEEMARHGASIIRPDTAVRAESDTVHSAPRKLKKPKKK